MTRDGLGVLDPDALCPSTGNRMPVWVWAPGCLLLAPHIGWVGVGELAEEEPCRECTPARVWRGARGRSSGKSS